ncbi:hypothetical protein MMC13_004812 [Lambiella insularis]|nr:hypothetical protein [Lambiella insularis]
MFYSHEVLTSRKYGVATVWLVATLGSNSKLKRINRKAILDVDIPKACRTITQPEAPMALRLQSNLLYGVSRVYYQQCYYVLVDAQAAQSNMRALLKVVRTSELDPDAGKARRDQLVLQDDPAFLPELDIPIMDLDLSLFETSTQECSHRTSVLSAQSAQSSQSSNRANEDSVLDLVIPTSDSGNTGGIGGFRVAETEGDLAREDNIERNLLTEEEGFNPNVDFNFDAEGNMIELGGASTAPANTLGHARAGVRSDSGIGALVRQDHEEAILAAQQGFGEAMDLNLDFLNTGDDYTALPPAEPFPEMVSGTAQPQSQDFLKSSSVLPVEESSDSAEAAQVRKRRAPRLILIDEAPELRNSDLTQWNLNYVANMAEARRQKAQHKVPAQARKNAAAWVFGAGINSVGKESRSVNIQNVLDIFAGNALMEALTGVSLSRTGRKRSRTDDEDLASEGSGRRIRSRTVEQEEEIGRGDSLILGDEAMPPTFGDDSIELGRDAPPPLLEDFSSQMPWNISASLHGSRQGSMARGRGFTSSVGGFPTSAGAPSSMPPPLFGTTGSFDRRASRMVSASPLLGRGPQRVGSLELPAQGDDEDLLGGQLGSNDPALEDFELYGPAAGVDTQTAAQSQWVRETLDQESTNFLDFIRAEMAPVSAGADDGEAPAPRTSVIFHELLPPRQHSKIVAAQAFHHVLALANKGLLIVDQSVGYGPINMSLAANA